MIRMDAKPYLIKAVPLRKSLYCYKRYQTLTANTDNLDTNCDGIELENRGNVLAVLLCNGERLELEPGESVAYTNEPGIQEITFYEKVIFEGTGKRKLFITRAYLTADPEFPDAGSGEFRA